MSRRPAYRTSAIAELDRQLRFTPPETLRDHVRRAEGLLAELEPGRTYPEDLIVFRVTRFRPRATGELPSALVGAAVLADLSAFITRATERAPLDPAAEEREAMRPACLAATIGVSERTLARWRRRGLVFHHVREADGCGAAVSCFRDAWEQFAARHPRLVARAAAFRPVTETERGTLGAAAAAALPTAGSRAAAHAAVAATTGRSRGAVRNAARRRDAERGGDAGGPRRAPLARAERLAARADARGIPVRAVGQRLGRSPAAVRRLVRVRRASELRGLDLGGPELPTFTRPDAADVLLGTSAAHEDLGRLPPVHRPIQMLTAWRTGPPGPPDRATLDALGAARGFLRWRARHILAGHEADVPALVLDDIETDLRWAALLTRRLAGLLLPAAIPPIEQAFGDALVRQPAEVMAEWLGAAMDVVAGVSIAHVPGSDAAPPRQAAWAISRRLAAGDVAIRGDARAGARHELDLDLGLRWSRVEPETGFLERTEAERRCIGRLAELQCRLLCEHEGLLDETGNQRPPRRIRALAAEAGVPAWAMTRRLRAAEQQLREVRRRSV